MNLLFFYHVFFAGVYYAYAFFNPSDSKKYFSRTLAETKSWFSSFELETGFIDFVSYPFFKIFKKGFINFFRKSPISVKMSATVFLMSSIAMSFVMSNLGIMMRQKSMVMYFLFFVIYYFVAEEKYNKIIKRRKRQAIIKKQQKLKTRVA